MTDKIELTHYERTILQTSVYFGSPSEAAITSCDTEIAHLVKLGLLDGNRNITDAGRAQAELHAADLQAHYDAENAKAFD